MRLLIWTMAVLVAVAHPLETGQQTGQSTTKPARPVAPVYYDHTPKSHGHPTESSTGTPPCGTRGSDCPPPQRGGPPPPDHTGGNIAFGEGLGIFAGTAITSLAVSQTSNPANKLSQNGPQFPGTVHMSLFQVTGFVKGGWPLVLDYESIAPTYAVLTIVTQNAPMYSVLLPTGDTGRRNVMVRLPPELGNELKIATFTLHSTVSAADPSPRYFRVYAFGCGNRAVGSVAIDQLRFSPKAITAQQAETHFGFHAHTDFDKLTAEFMQVGMVDHCLEGQIFDNKKINKRLREGDYLNDDWNGKKAHAGQIQFRVRGWMTADGGGDWVSAFSPDLVLKQ